MHMQQPWMMLEMVHNRLWTKGESWSPNNPSSNGDCVRISGSSAIYPTTPSQASTLMSWCVRNRGSQRFKIHKLISNMLPNNTRSIIAMPIVDHLLCVAVCMLYTCDVFWETPYLVLFFPENCLSKEVNSIGCMLCNCVLFILFKFICVLFCVCICNELQKGHIFILLIMNTLLVLFSFWGIWYHFTGGFSLHDVIEKKKK
eukprot:222379_1